jgi:TonB family protein
MATAATPSTATRQQVVVVDADLESLKSLVAPLRAEFEFHVTISASDALALLDHRPIAAIVAAQKLFSTNGIELLSEARRRSPRTTRVLLADAGERRAIEHSHPDRAAFQILSRPCTAQQLREVLQVAAWSSSVTSDETGEVEHVVMETTRAPQQTDTSGLPVTVLTTDADLYEAIRMAVQGRHETYLATRLEDATELAATGRCPVLVTDMALAQPALERIARHLGTHEHALVTIVVGSREQGNALMNLLGTGVIHRFLLKPVTSGLARLAIDSASRHHQGLLTQPKRPAATPPAPRAAQRPAARPAPPPVATHVEPPHIEPAPPSPPPKPPAPKAAAPKSAGAPRFAPSPVLAAERQPDSTFELTTPLAAEVGELPELPVEDIPLPSRKKPVALIGGGAAALVLVAVAGAWFWYQSTKSPPQDPRVAAIEVNLAAAAIALDAGRLIEPAGDNAVHFYGEVLKHDPANSTALAGLEQVAERFIEQAENLMVEGRLDEAATALANVRRVQPDHRRLRFLDTQLRKEQQDRLVLQARESATAGDTRRAQQLLDEAARVVSDPSGELESAQRAISARERTTIVERELELARQRLGEGRLVSPANDSAKSHLQAARRSDPSNVAVQQGLRDLTERVLAQANQALERRQIDNARTLVREAQDLGAPADQLATLRASIDTAQVDRQKNDLLQLVVRRSEENRLLEPAQDSARFYLDRLIQADPQHPAVAQGVAALGARLVANAQLAISQRQFDSAQRLLTEARAIGFTGQELTVAENTLRIARQPTAAATTPVAPAIPRRVRAITPEYPRRALEDEVEGWVDVSFALTPAGDVVEARVEGATPRNVFDRAALTAVRQWKFEPRDPVAAYTQRIRTRVEFKLREE